jgi:hypothetical protein
MPCGLRPFYLTAKTAKVVLFILVALVVLIISAVVQA